MRRATASSLAIAACIAVVSGCAASTAKEVVGSKQVVAKTTQAMVVESVAIYIPFKAVVHNGTARQIVIRGEDNLVSQISVKESTVSKWELRAPADLVFEQHSDMQIEIPFIDMVSISFYSDGVTFADQPFETTQVAAPDAGTP